MYDPNENKLDPKIVLGYIIGYFKHSKGYRSCFPSHNTRMVESMIVKSLELYAVKGSSTLSLKKYESSSSSTAPSSDRYGGILPNPIIKSRQQVFETHAKPKIVQNEATIKITL